MVVGIGVGDRHNVYVNVTEDTTMTPKKTIEDNTEVVKDKEIKGTRIEVEAGVSKRHGDSRKK